MRVDYEYIVLGLGGLGSAAAYWLSRRAGVDVLGLEQFELGHVRGESQDLDDVPESVRKAMTFHLAARVEEVLEFALEQPAESGIRAA